MEKVIKLENGFSCKIDDAALDDFDLVDILAEIEECADDEEQALHAIRLCGKALEKILGKENYKALKDSMRVDGRIPLERFNGLVAEVITAAGEESKN